MHCTSDQKQDLRFLPYLHIEPKLFTQKCLTSLLLSALIFLATSQTLAAALQDNLKNHLNTLTELPTGRAPGTTGHATTRRYLDHQLREMGFAPTGLDPAATNFEIVDSFSSGLVRHFLGNLLYQAYPINDAGPRDDRGTYAVHNVVGVLKSKDPSVKAWRMVIAHYDHLSNRDQRHFSGASDNAAGVAALLEVARKFAKDSQNPKNPPLPFNLMIAFTDREEVSTMGYALVGATLLRDHIQKQWGNLSDFLVIAVDLLGVKMIEGSPQDLFFLTHDSIDRSCARRETLEVACAPVSILEGMRFPASLFPQDMLERCDFAPFRRSGVATAFITGGSPWFYHTPEDTVSRIDFSLLEKTVQFLFNTLHRPDLKALLSAPPKIKTAYANETLEIFSSLVELLLRQPEIYPVTQAEFKAFQKKLFFLEGCMQTPCTQSDVQKTVFDFLVLIHDLGERKIKK